MAAMALAFSPLVGIDQGVQWLGRSGGRTKADAGNGEGGGVDPSELKSWKWALPNGRSSGIEILGMGSSGIKCRMPRIKKKGKRKEERITRVALIYNYYYYYLKGQNNYNIMYQNESVQCIELFLKIKILRQLQSPSTCFHACSICEHDLQYDQYFTLNLM